MKVPRRQGSGERLGLYVLTHTSRYLEECLESVRSQTVTPTRVIVIDNGSPEDEGVQAIVSRLGYCSVRITPAVSTAAARNVGCEVLEKCELIVNLDGDDLILPRYVETYWGLACEGRADIVFGAAELFGTETGIEFSRSQLGPAPDLRRGNYVPMNSLFRRDLWRQAGGFDPSIGLYDDYDFWLSLAERKARFVLVDEVLWKYRKHSESRMSVPDSETRALSRRYIREKHHRFVNGFSPVAPDLAKSPQDGSTFRARISTTEMKR